MCPNVRVCAMVLTCCVMTDVLTCGLNKDECPFLKSKEPDEPTEKTLEPYPMFSDGAVVASASAFFIESEFGNKVGQSKDGRELYYFKPQEVGIVGGTFTVVDKNGNRKIIEFEKSSEGIG